MHLSMWHFIQVKNTITENNSVTERRTVQMDDRFHVLLSWEYLHFYGNKDLQSKE